MKLTAPSLVRLAGALAALASPALAQEAGWHYSPLEGEGDRAALGCGFGSTPTEFSCLAVRCEDDFEVGLHIYTSRPGGDAGRWLVEFDKEGERFEVDAKADGSPYHARAEGGDGAGRLHEVRLLGELAGLGIVHGDDIDLAEHAPERRVLPFDPEVHRVEGHQLRPLLHLAEHVELEPGVDVGEEEVGHTGQRGRELGAKVGENVELGVEGTRLVQIVAVRARPAV